MSKLLLFSEIKPINLEIVGTKAINLSLNYRKQKIPPAFVLTTLGCQYFLESKGIKQKINEMLANINESNVQETANSIQRLIVETKFPDDLSALITENYLALSASRKLSADEIINSEDEEVNVAVRSSYNDKEQNNTNHLTLLNIKGKNEIITSIKVVLASEYTSKNIFIRFENNLPAESGIAVIIQKIANPEKSAFVYTGKNNLSIKAVFGCGDGLKDKNVFPDEYEVEREGLKIRKTTINNQTLKYQLSSSQPKVDKVYVGEIGRMQKLSETEIIKCAEIAFGIGENKLIEIGIIGEEFNVLSIKEYDYPEEKDSQFEKPYTLTQNDDEVLEEEDFVKDEMRIYDELETENEARQEPLKELKMDYDLIPKKEMHPIIEKVEDGIVNYDEEEDLKEEFDKEDFRVYEDDYSTERKAKKPFTSIKSRKSEDEKIQPYIKPEEVLEQSYTEDEPEEVIEEKHEEIRREKPSDKKTVIQKNKEEAGKEKNKDSEDDDGSIFSSLKKY